jgi:hypothetical protein
MLADLGPAGLRITTELEVFRDPSRIDILVQRGQVPGARRKPRILRGLWRLVTAMILIELKTVPGPYKRGDLFHLFSIAEGFVGQRVQELKKVSEISVVLMVPALTRSLQRDVQLHGWRLVRLGKGYARLDGCDFLGVVVFLDEVAKAERDDLIGCIAHRRIRTVWAAQWLVNRGGIPQRLAMAKIEGVSKLLRRMMTMKEFRAEMLKSVPERERVAGVSAKERLAGLPAKERLAGLPAKERLAGLTPSDLAAVIKKLPLATRRKLAAELASR